MGEENKRREEICEELNNFDENTILKVFNEWDDGSLSNEVDNAIGQEENEDLEEFIKLLKAENSPMNIRSKINKLFSKLDKEEKEKIAEELLSKARESY